MVMIKSDYANISFAVRGKYYEEKCHHYICSGLIVNTISL